MTQRNILQAFDEHLSRAPRDAARKDALMRSLPRLDAGFHTLPDDQEPARSPIRIGAIAVIVVVAVIVAVTVCLQ